MKILLKELVGKVRQIAAETSHLIMDIYIRSDVQICTKSDNSPLTEADMVAHRYIVNQLNLLTPDIPVLSEENVDDIDAKVRLDWDRYWLVDPLDGTKEFIAQNGEFAVNIALIENNQPILGVVAVPAKKVSYFAASGLGAFKAGPDEVAHSIQCRSVSHRPLDILISRHSHPDALENYLEQIPSHHLQALGSSIKMCRIAEGKADLYPRFGQTSEWDTAASQCILTEAGGKIVDLKQGAPLKYGEKMDLHNPQFVAIGKVNKEFIKNYLSI